MPHSTAAMKVLSRGASVGGARRRWPASHGTAEGKVGKGGLGRASGVPSLKCRKHRSGEAAEVSCEFALRSLGTAKWIPARQGEWGKAGERHAAGGDGGSGTRARPRSCPAVWGSPKGRGDEGRPVVGGQWGGGWVRAREGAVAFRTFRGGIRRVAAGRPRPYISRIGLMVEGGGK